MTVVDGHWRYLYRAIDADVDTVDSILSETLACAGRKRAGHIGHPIVKTQA